MGSWPWKPPPTPQPKPHSIGVVTHGPTGSTVSLVNDQPATYGHTQTTDANGNTVFAGIPAGTTIIQIAITAAGYQPYNIRVTVPDRNVNVVLGPCGPTDVSVPPLQPIVTLPTRDQVCAVFCSWQGLQVDLQDGQGPRHWWDWMIVDCTTAQRALVWAAKHARGETHLMISLDLGGLSTLPLRVEIAREAVANGFKLQLMCMGDGNDEGEPDHDPGALGYSWLMANFPAIYAAWGDLAAHTVFVPGYDGVVPAWQPYTRVNNWVRLARQTIDAGGAGYVGLELSAGYCTWTGEANIWVTPDGQMVDVIIQEFPIGMSEIKDIPPAYLNADGTWKASVSNETRAPWTQVYQIVGRMVSPYHAPAGQPDDHNAPYMLGGGTPRGPFYYIAKNGETSTYEWIRTQRITPDAVERRSAYIAGMGARW